MARLQDTRPRGRSSRCLTIGYVSPLSGDMVPLGKAIPSRSHKAKRSVSQLRERDQRAIARKVDGTWCELDDALYPELSEV